MRYCYRCKFYHGNLDVLFKLFVKYLQFLIFIKISSQIILHNTKFKNQFTFFFLQQYLEYICNF